MWTQTLPFGLISAPLIFTAVADALQWIMERSGVQWVAHYIDDFVTVGAPATNECSANFARMHAVCERLGMPVEPEKDEGPASTVSFLGIELDTMALECRLPAEKLLHLRKELARWRVKKKSKKKGTAFAHWHPVTRMQSGPLGKVISSQTN